MANRYVNNGKVRDKQRYKCKEYGNNFVVGDESEKVSVEGKALAALVCAKSSYGFIANLLNVTRPAVQKWIRKIASWLPEPKPEDIIEEVQIDEMWHFIERKRKLWIWRSLDCSLNTTIRWFIGDRSAETLKKFYKTKLKHLNAYFYTDDWERCCQMIS